MQLAQKLLASIYGIFLESESNCDVAAKLHYFQFFIIDVNGFRLGPEYPFRTAYETLILLNKELELYNPDLLKKPCVLAVNKMDTENSKEKMEEFETCLQSNMEKGIGKVIF